MPYLPSPPFNPPISAIPILDSSSGDPSATKDPKSVASIGKNIQAMQDQASADRVYDAPLKEGFGNYEGYAKVQPNKQPMLRSAKSNQNLYAKAPKKDAAKSNKLQNAEYKPENASMPEPAPAVKAVSISTNEGFSNLGLGNPENYFKNNDFRYPDGFNKLESPQIVNSQACKRIQGFSDMNARLTPIVATVVALGAVLVLTSFL